MEDVVVKRVIDRLSPIVPSLIAQVVSGMNGVSHHGARGLVPHSAVLDRNCALHAGFASDALIGDLSAAQKRWLQRGKRRETGPHNDQVDELQDAPASKVETRQNDAPETKSFLAHTLSESGKDYVTKSKEFCPDDVTTTMQAIVDQMHSYATDEHTDSTEPDSEASQRASGGRALGCPAAVLAVIRERSTTLDGLHMDQILQNTGWPDASEVIDAILMLEEAGEVYSTITDSHFAAT